MLPFLVVAGVVCLVLTGHATAAAWLGGVYVAFAIIVHMSVHRIITRTQRRTYRKVRRPDWQYRSDDFYRRNR